MKRIYKFLAKLVKRMIAMSTPSCEIIGFKISQSIDAEASFFDKLLIRLHTFGCIYCYRYRQQLVHLHDKLQGLQPDDTLDSANLSTAACEHMKHVLRDSSASL